MQLGGEWLHECPASVLTDTCPILAPRVVVIVAGVSTFVWCKRDIDRQRLELMKADQKAARIKARPHSRTIGNAARHN